MAFESKVLNACHLCLRAKSRPYILIMRRGEAHEVTTFSECRALASVCQHDLRRDAGYIKWQIFGAWRNIFEYRAVSARYFDQIINADDRHQYRHLFKIIKSLVDDFINISIPLYHQGTMLFSPVMALSPLFRRYLYGCRRRYYISNELPFLYGLFLYFLLTFLIAFGAILLLIDIF